MAVTIDSTSQRYTSGPQPEPDIWLLHTTEGMGWPGYAGGSQAPHDTIRAIPGKGIEVRRHYPYDQYAKALANSAAPGETNRRGVIQTELMGTCDPSQRARMYFWPGADDTVLAALADYYRPVLAKYRIPLRAPAFQAYPGSYGSRGRTNEVRMSPTQFAAFEGICGHQHAPENDHGDPGAFPIARLLAFLGESTPTPTGDEIDMADIKDLEASIRKIIREEVAKVAPAVWDQRFPLSDADRRALRSAPELRDISAGGLLKTGVRLQARQTTSEAVLKEVRE